VGWIEDDQDAGRVDGPQDDERQHQPDKMDRADAA
jgi:hypothetical protein